MDDEFCSQLPTCSALIPKVFAFPICCWCYCRSYSSSSHCIAVLLQTDNMHLRMVQIQCSFCISRYVVLCSKQKSRICRDSTRSTTTPTGSPGWTSCSTSWRSEELQSLSVPPFLKILSTFTNYTFTQRIEEAF